MQLFRKNVYSRLLWEILAIRGMNWIHKLFFRRDHHELDRDRVIYSAVFWDHHRFVFLEFA